MLKGGTKLLKGGTKLLKGGTKLLKGGTKLLKGGTKSLGWATGGGGVVRPPRPPLATGLNPNTPKKLKPYRRLLSCSPLFSYIRPTSIAGADPGFLKRGSILGLQAKKGGPGGGPTLGPILKSLQRGPKRGSGPPGSPALDPPMYRIDIGLGNQPKCRV